MPIYEFICKTCGNTEDVLTTRVMFGGDIDKVQCRQCRAMMQKTEIAGPAVIKINGFSEANGYSKEAK